MDGMFVSLTNSCAEVLTPNVMVLGGGALGRRLGHKGGALRNWISAPLRRNRRGFASCLCCLLSAT